MVGEVRGLRKFDLMKYLIVKRLFDVFFSFLVLVIIFPFLIIISLIIKYDTNGPALFLGIRSGKNNKDFKIYKFRTMYYLSNTDKMTTSATDERITPVGRFLRKYKLDELPQFINVLKGEMSIVGPRPELPYYTRKYSKNERVILSVQPGITDFASIKYHKLSAMMPDKDTNNFFEEKILKNKNLLRIKYVNELSFLTDLNIFFKTIFKILLIFVKK